MAAIVHFGPHGAKPIASSDDPPGSYQNNSRRQKSRGSLQPGPGCGGGDYRRAISSVEDAIKREGTPIAGLPRGTLDPLRSFSQPRTCKMPMPTSGAESAPVR